MIDFEILQVKIVSSGANLIINGRIYVTGMEIIFASEISDILYICQAVPSDHRTPRTSKLEYSINIKNN